MMCVYGYVCVYLFVCVCMCGGLGCRRSRVVTFTAIRLRGPGFKPRPGQKFENENFCFGLTPAVVKVCHSCNVRLIKTPLYKTLFPILSYVCVCVYLCVCVNVCMYLNA